MDEVNPRAALLWIVDNPEKRHGSKSGNNSLVGSVTDGFRGLSAKRCNWRKAKARTSSTLGHCYPSPPTQTIGGEGRISREKRHCLPISRLIWRKGSNSPRKMRISGSLHSSLAEGAYLDC